MDENKQVTTREVTDDEILEAITKLSNENREALLEMEFNEIRKIANDPKNGVEYINQWAKIVSKIEKLCTAVVMFNSALKYTEKSTEFIIKKMEENYKTFSDEEKLKFSEKILSMNNSEVSTQLFKNTWRKFKRQIKELMKSEIK